MILQDKLNKKYKRQLTPYDLSVLTVVNQLQAMSLDYLPPVSQLSQRQLRRSEATRERHLISTTESRIEEQIIARMLKQPERETSLGESVGQFSMKNVSQRHHPLLEQGYGIRGPPSKGAQATLLMREPCFPKKRPTRIKEHFTSINVHKYIAS